VTWDIENSVPRFLSTTRRASGAFGLQGAGLSERHSGGDIPRKVENEGFEDFSGAQTWMRFFNAVAKGFGTMGLDS
jgi:hypothetical protein